MSNNLMDGERVPAVTVSLLFGSWYAIDFMVKISFRHSSVMRKLMFQ